MVRIGPLDTRLLEQTTSPHPKIKGFVIALLFRPEGLVHDYLRNRSGEIGAEKSGQRQATQKGDLKKKKIKFVRHRVRLLLLATRGRNAPHSGPERAKKGPTPPGHSDHLHGSASQPTPNLAVSLGKPGNGSYPGWLRSGSRHLPSAFPIGGVSDSPDTSLLTIYSGCVDHE